MFKCGRYAEKYIISNLTKLLHRKVKNIKFKLKLKTLTFYVFPQLVSVSVLCFIQFF